jgi:hypothetical protein
MILQLTMACGVLLLASINRAAAGADWLYLADNGDYYLNLPRDNWSEYFPLRVVWSKLRLTTSTMKEGIKYHTHHHPG